MLSTFRWVELYVSISIGIAAERLSRILPPLMQVPGNP